MVLTKLNQAEAIRYMGYGSHKPDESIQAILDECEKKLLEVIRPNYIYKVFEIEHSPDGIILLGTSLMLKGNDIENHLKDCKKCVLMCCTISTGADRLIRMYEAVDMTKAVILDSLASTAVEQVCNLAEEEIKNNLSDFYFTWRFSPGYGDMPISIQRNFLDILDATKRIGVSVTNSMMLTPSKSVTAVMGISENEIPKGRRGCVTCNLKNTCAYRKRGEFCGF